MTAQLAEIWEILDAMKKRIKLQNTYAKEIHRQVKLMTRIDTHERHPNDKRNLPHSEAR